MEVGVHVGQTPRDSLPALEASQNLRRTVTGPKIHLWHRLLTCVHNHRHQQWYRTSSYPVPLQTCISSSLVTSSAENPISVHISSDIVILSSERSAHDVGTEGSMDLLGRTHDLRPHVPVVEDTPEPSQDLTPKTMPQLGFEESEQIDRVSREFANINLCVSKTLHNLPILYTQKCSPKSSLGPTNSASSPLLAFVEGDRRYLR